MPRFDQSFSGLCEQNLHDTLQLKQRFLDAKAKRAPKTNKDKKQQESIQSSVHVVSKKNTFHLSLMTIFRLNLLVLEIDHLQSLRPDV